MLTCVSNFLTPWTVAHQAPLSMGFPGKNTGVLPCLSPGDLSDPGIKPTSLAWQVDSLPLNHLESPQIYIHMTKSLCSTPESNTML